MKSVCAVLLFGLCLCCGGQQQKFRPSFIQGAKSVVDAIDRMNQTRPDDEFTPAMERTKDRLDELSRAASTDPERKLARILTSYMDAIGICHEFLKLGDEDEVKKGYFDEASWRHQALMLMGLHKDEGVWTPGAPKPGSGQ